ncbi:MAG: hypothetical protein ACOCNB_09640 [Acetivibrio ethanolgignens]
MVHVKKCPLGKRGKPSHEFTKDGMMQIYCLGWINKMTDEYLDECRACKDLAGGEQAQKDWEEWKESAK